LTVGTAVAWFVAGLVVFRLCARVAKRRGGLSQM
jgi:hypothetical protein